MDDLITLQNEKSNSNHRFRFKNKSYYCFILLFYFFIFRDLLESYVSVFGYFDELIALLGLLLFIINLIFTGRLQIKLYNVCICLFVVAGLLSNLIMRYQPAIAALSDVFLNIKFWLVIYTGKVLFKDFNLKKYANRIYFHIKIILWLFLFLVLVDNVFGIFNVFLEYGFRSTHLFYSHPTIFIWNCILLCVLLISIRKYVLHADVYFFFPLFLMLTTLKTKAFVTSVAFVMIYYFIVLRHKKIKISHLIIFGILALIVGWSKIYYYFFSDIQNDSARYRLLISSFSIMKDYFPFGVGFGTYASYMSGVYYSPIYQLYGLSKVNGLIEGHTYYTSDSFWPMILGQTGILGLIFYILAIYFLFKSILKIRKIDFSFYGMGIMILIAILIASTAESSFAHPVAIPLAFILGMLMNITKDSKKVQNANNF